MSSSPGAPHNTPTITIITVAETNNENVARGIPDTAEYRSHASHFNVDARNVLRYDGQPVCKFLNTMRSCRAGSACTFPHIPLGCAFYFLARQGCEYADNVCPFSHKANSYVKIKKLYPCIANGCKKDCMRLKSHCQECFNLQTRQRRQEAERQDRYRSSTLQKHPSGMTIIENSRNMFIPGNIHYEQPQCGASPFAPIPPIFPIYQPTTGPQSSYTDPSQVMSIGERRHMM
jgi:hypothetical protein